MIIRGAVLSAYRRRVVVALVVPLLLLSVRLDTSSSSSSDAFVITTPTTRTILRSSDNNDWNGQVVSNDQSGRIRGCTLENTNGRLTEWIITIDGEEADLGKFSDAIYRKIAADAKQQRFQGFRPGTIPPHLEPTYRAFAMDECAREATLEAMQQNNIRPFEDARLEMSIENVSIPPPPIKKKKKKKKGRSDVTNAVEEQETEEPAWLTFENMKGAIDAGWKPGQSFSFVAKKVRGQKLKDEDVSKAKPLGVGGIDMNQIAADSIGKSVDE